MIAVAQLTAQSIKGKSMDLLIHRDYTTGTYDMIFDNGTCPTTSDLVDVVTQRLYIRLKTLFQEWFLNVEYGVPYLERILGKKIRKSTVDIIIQEQIMMEKGVKQIVSFQSTFDGPSRVYSCRFTVKAEDGNVSSVITI